MSAKIIGNVARRIVSPSNMRPGEIGTFWYGESQVIALRTFENLVNLNRPTQTWDLSASYDVELLPEGTRVEVVAESIG